MKNSLNSLKCMHKGGRESLSLSYGSFITTYVISAYHN